MSVPHEGNTDSPRDAAGRYFAAWWDAVAGVFRAPRADSAANLKVAASDPTGAPFFTAGNPGAVNVTDRVGRQLGAVTLGAGIPAGANLIGRVRDELDAPILWLSDSRTAPAAGATITDTGPLTAGNYRVVVFITITAAAGPTKYVELVRRNAADTTTLNNIDFAAPGTFWRELPKVVIAANERFRVFNGSGAGEAGSRYSAMILLYPVP